MTDVPAWALLVAAADGEDAAADAEVAGAEAVGLVLVGADVLELELELQPAMVSTAQTVAATATALGAT